MARVAMVCALGSLGTVTSALRDALDKPNIVRQPFHFPNRAAWPLALRWFPAGC